MYYQSFLKKKSLFSKYLPINISDYDIYDIYHNDNNNLIIISPLENKPLNIRYKENFFDVKICPDQHTYIYILKNKIEYKSKICLNINGKNINTKVNKYPEFKDEIIMSTMVYNEDNYIRQWIKFHNNIGVSRFIIYDNSKIDDQRSYKSVEKKSNLKNVLQDFIKNGLVILINWSYPKRLKKSGFSAQSSQQNHSIWAFQNSKYIGLFDIDEYINMQNDTNIQSFFNNLIQDKKLNIDNIGSFRLLNKFFYNPNNLPTNGFNFLKIYNCDKITLFGREKNFIIPKNVSSVCIHIITEGKKMYNISSDIIFFNHYYFLNKEHRGKKNTNIIDNSIYQHTLKLL